LGFSIGFATIYEYTSAVLSATVGLIGVQKCSADDASIAFSLLCRLRKKVEIYGGDYSLDTKMMK